MNSRSHTRPEEGHKFVGIIGHPIAQTLSPLMHTAAFEELHLPFVFGVFDVIEEFLPALVMSLRKQGCAGASVTIPHKQRIIPLLDEVRDDAAALGAVNTVVNRNGRLIGFNTDMLGIKEALEPVRKNIEGSSVLLLGAGGAARAALYAISQFFSPKGVRIHNRSKRRASKVVGEFRRLFPSISYETISNNQQLSSEAASASLVVNSTSLGMTPLIDTSPLPATVTFSNHQIIFDIVYNPVETVLLRRAKLSGAQTINGVEMFVHQGAHAFELWTGSRFPIERARTVVTRALGV